jgi:hypothetical protein
MAGGVMIIFGTFVFAMACFMAWAVREAVDRFDMPAAAIFGITSASLFALVGAMAWFGVA